MSTPAFVHSARRKALAARHQAAGTFSGAPPGGRFHGRCECGAIHASPDMRWTCEPCGVALCLSAARETHLRCPSCGAGLEARGPGMTE